MAFHDGFITPGAWENFFSKKKRERTLLDTREWRQHCRASPRLTRF
jgi:hypothetical protein